MANNEIIKGDDLRVEVGEAGSEQTIFAATSCELSFSREMKETIHKDNEGGWAESSPDKKSATLSSEALFVATSSTAATVHDMWTYWDDGTKLPFKFTDNETGNIEYSGHIYVKGVKMGAPLGENATVSIEYQVTGPVSKATIAA